MSLADYDTKAQAEIARWPGASIVEVNNTKKHRRVVIGYEGRTRFVITPATAGDSRRGPMRHVNDIRRVLRELGAARNDN